MDNPIVSLFAQKCKEITLLSKESFTPEQFERVDYWFKDFIQTLRTLDIPHVILSDSQMQEYASTIRMYFDRYFMFRETMYSLDSLLNNNTTSFDISVPHLAKLEMKVIKPSLDSHVCFVGSGAYPWSAILYAQSFGCKVTAIDSRPEPVALSQRLIEKLNLANLIRVFCIDALEFDYCDCSEVVVAAMTNHKYELFRKLGSGAHKQMSLLIRSGVGKYRFLYEQFEFDTSNIKAKTALYHDHEPELQTYVF